MIELINSSKIAEARIIHEKKNSIDLIWNDKPKSKSKPFFFLENKISGTAFNLDQLNVGKEAFINRLKESLEEESEEE